MTVNEVDSGAGWVISDIEGDSTSWTLSSDVNMLRLLETFSDNLLSSLNSSSRALEELITFSEVTMLLLLGADLRLYSCTILHYDLTLY